MIDNTQGGASPEKSALAYDARLAEFVVRPFARAPISPNMLTVFGMLVGLTSCWLFSRGDPVLANWGGLCFMFGVFMDHVDGAHARSSGKTSRFGHYLDHFGAATTYCAGFIGIGLGASGALTGEWGPWLGLITAISITVIFSVRIRVELQHGADVVEQTPRAGFEIEDILYLVGPVAWLGWLEGFILAAGIGTPIFLIWVLWDAWRLSRRESETKA
jgi:archaetidylinositol phosphate synthase